MRELLMNSIDGSMTDNTRCTRCASRKIMPVPGPWPERCRLVSRDLIGCGTNTHEAVRGTPCRNGIDD